jgi:putative ABC transport system permease protein
MFRNHFKIAFRSLFNKKGYTFLNILGLAIGIASCLVIFQYTAYERSYDRFGDKADQMVRLRLDSYQKGKLAWQSATVYPAIAPAMKRDFPEVENFCRLYAANLLLSNDQKNIKFTEDKGYFADPSVIDMFAVSLVEGNPKTALDGPFKMLLSESMAKKYFAGEDPIGKRLTVRDGHLRNFEITGVFKDYPKNSHLIINDLVSYSTLGAQIRMEGDTSNRTETSWGWYDFYAYLQLRKGADWKKLESRLPAFTDRYINSKEWMKRNNIKEALYFIPLKDIHLYSNSNEEAEVNGDGKAVAFLYLIAFFIISIAWINYTNLATARSLERAREVGVRKVLGAIRADLIVQFLVESFLLNGVAIILAITAAILLAPSFNRLIGTHSDSSFFLPLNYWLGFMALFFSGAFLSGIYPAFILSGFNPITVLKGLFKNSTKGWVLRKALIIGQFATSVILIAGTIIVYRQVQFMRDQKLGVNINQTLVLQGVRSVQDSLFQNIFQPFKTELLREPGIKQVTASSNVMGQEIYWTTGVRRLGPENPTSVTLYHLGVDYDFLPAFDLKLVAGRNFSKSFTTDNEAALLNEKAAEMLGFKNPQEAINNKLNRGGDTVTIVGIVTNYHHQGLQKAIDPMIILLRPNQSRFYSLKMTATRPRQMMASIEKIWNKYFPSDPFNYFFLDQSYNQQYQSDIEFGEVFGIFALLAILIACFGLLGLSAYNVSQRIKEIGIRKVMGASVPHVLFLLSKDFLVLVFISFFVAFPVCWLVMNNWLQDFAFRIEMHWWVFAIAATIAIMIAILTISFQAYKAAVANPVSALRSE